MKKKEKLEKEGNKRKIVNKSKKRLKQKQEDKERDGKRMQEFGRRIKWIKRIELNIKKEDE